MKLTPPTMEERQAQTGRLAFVLGLDSAALLAAAEEIWATLDPEQVPFDQALLSAAPAGLERWGIRDTLYTTGHSVLQLADFLRELRRGRIQVVVDVRQYPGSRKYPHFGRTALQRSLAEAGIGYLWARQLGGRREGNGLPLPYSPNYRLRGASFRSYADYMLTCPDFAPVLADVLALARVRRVAVMCSEAQPYYDSSRMMFRCHRMLISDAAVLQHGVTVLHLDKAGTVVPHLLTPFARRAESGHVLYDGGVPVLV